MRITLGVALCACQILIGCSSSGPVTSTNSGDACLPFTMPTASALFGSSQKVFAHYFYPFPLSEDNLPSAQD